MVEVKTLAILVSANGFGHIRRQILIARELMLRHKNLQTTFALTDRQYQRFKLEIESLGELAKAAIGLTEDSVRWRNDAGSYTAENLNGWESEWEQDTNLINSDFVISDNLVGVLKRRPDALLSGSFLWHEVISEFLNQNESCREFVNREIELLKRNKPRMICNQSLASNAVMNLTNPIGTSWMIEDTNNRAPSEIRQSILVHGGGTRSLDSEVLEIASMLRQENFEAFTDLENDNCSFDYQEETWQKIGVVVCRPGAGTATECVRWKIPMLVLRDKRNSEAEFNAEVLIRLGIAHELLNRQSNEDLIKFVRSMTAVESRKTFLEPFERCGRNGIVEAVNFLEDHWGLSRQVK